MPFVKRDERGAIAAVSQEQAAGFEEELDSTSAELHAFVKAVGGASGALGRSDQDLIRVLEDVVDLMIAKGLILFTELPADAQEKIMRRQRLRTELGATLDLIRED